MKPIILILAGIVAATVLAIAGAAWLRDRASYANTAYSERFTTEAFARVTPGMPRAAVIEALGPPLATRLDERFPAWAIADEATRARFGRDKEITRETLLFSRPKNRAVDFHSVSVTIGPDQTVIDSRSYVTD